MRIWLADDAVLIRDGLAGLLTRQGFEVTQLFDTADQLREAGLNAAEERLPDVIITDVRMPPTMSDDGLRAALEIREHHPAQAIMVLSQYLAPAYAQRLFAGDRAGGTGYLLKEKVGHVADFVRALQVVRDGGVTVDPDVAARMLGQDRGIQSLTPREREVIALMAQGASNTEIADALVLSTAAVAKHVSNIFQRLGLLHGEENRRVRAILRYLSETGGIA